MAGYLKEDTSPRSYMQESNLARGGPGHFPEELRSLERKLDVTTELFLPQTSNEHEKEDRTDAATKCLGQPLL